MDRADMTSIERPSYEAGMFVREDYSDAHIDDELREALKVDGELISGAHHEAGHATVAYLVGFGIDYVRLEKHISKNDNGYAIAVGGFTSFADKRRVGPYGRYTIRHLKEGVVTCAGPAAEYRFRKLLNYPLRMRGGTKGDHSSIQKIVDWLDNKCPGQGAEFRDSAWQLAWEIVSYPRVWEAIHDLADELNSELDCGQQYDDLEIGQIGGPYACALLRGHGLRPKRSGPILPLQLAD